MLSEADSDGLNDDDPNDYDVVGLKEAADQLAVVLTDKSRDSLSHFTCAETDAILRVLVMAGHIGSAATALLGHAVYGVEQDEPGSPHHYIVAAYNSGELSPDPEFTSYGAGEQARALAEGYVVPLCER